MYDNYKSYNEGHKQAQKELIELFPSLTFIKDLSGYIPVVAECYYGDQYFCFRARYDSIQFILANDENWSIQDEMVKTYTFTITTDPFVAGVLNGMECKIAIAMFIQTVLNPIADPWMHSIQRAETD